MKDAMRLADEIPVTLVIALAYLTMAALTHPFADAAEQTELLFAHGSLTAAAVSEGEPWRLLSYAFLHYGVLHLGLNLLSLIAFGPPLERTIGSARFALLYVLSALGGGLAVCLLYNPLQPVVGGSGALFGMLGAGVAWMASVGRTPLQFLDYDGPRSMMSLIAVNLVIGFVVPMISNTGHIGGLVTGFAVTMLWLMPSRRTTALWWAWRGAFGALLLGVTCYALRPATRWDWLYNRSIEATTARERDQLQRAAAMARYGLEAADQAHVLRLLREEIGRNR